MTVKPIDADTLPTQGPHVLTHVNDFAKFLHKKPSDAEQLLFEARSYRSGSQAST
jgi:hypothetical protein